MLIFSTFFFVKIDLFSLMILAAQHLKNSVLYAMGYEP